MNRGGLGRERVKVKVDKKKAGRRETKSEKVATTESGEQIRGKGKV